MLCTKQDYINCLEKIITPLKDYYTKGCAGIKCGTFGVSYGEGDALMEAFSRVLWGLGPLWGGGHECEGFDKLCLSLCIFVRKAHYRSSIHMPAVDFSGRSGRQSVPSARQSLITIIRLLQISLEAT